MEALYAVLFMLWTVLGSVFYMATLEELKEHDNTNFFYFLIILCGVTAWVIELFRFIEKNKSFIHKRLKLI